MDKHGLNFGSGTSLSGGVNILVLVRNGANSWQAPSDDIEMKKKSKFSDSAPSHRANL